MMAGFCVYLYKKCKEEDEEHREFDDFNIPGRITKA